VACAQRAVPAPQSLRDSSSANVEHAFRWRTASDDRYRGSGFSDGTDFGFQSQNGFWFHPVMDGSPNPNGIIPSMERVDEEERRKREAPLEEDIP